MRIEQLGNRVIVRGTVDEILEHITALTASVRTVASGQRQASSSRPASVAVEEPQGNRYIPGSLQTVVEGDNV